MIARPRARRTSIIGDQRVAGRRHAWQGAPVTTLEGARVLVVGAGGGLGAPLCAALDAAGARLTLAGRRREPLEALGIDGAAIVTADLTDAGGPLAMVEAATAAHGGLDGVVLVAGVVAFGPVTELEDSTLEELVAANFLGPVRLLRAAAGPLAAGAEERGEDSFVLNVSAVVAEQAPTSMGAYAASKAALTSFDDVAARELRRSRVRVVDARPPHTETGLATRPIAGGTPRLPQGLDPAAVAARLVAAIEDDEKDLPSEQFTA